METKPPVSTNGESTPIFDFSGNPVIPVQVRTDPTMELSGEPHHTDHVMVEWDPKTQTLTHSTVTSAYAVYRSQQQMRHLPVISFAAWAGLANAEAGRILSKEAELATQDESMTQT